MITYGDLKMDCNLSNFYKNLLNSLRTRWAVRSLGRRGLGETFSIRGLKEGHTVNLRYNELSGSIGDVISENKLYQRSNISYIMNLFVV